MKNLLIFSTTTVHGSAPLSYAEEAIKAFFRDVKTVTFIPFARPSGINFDQYTDRTKQIFDSFGIELVGIHESNDVLEAAKTAEAFFVGGGNTFLLLKTIYDLGLFDIIKTTVNSGTPYMGTSAGSNLTGQTVNNTNDMPIVYPSSFDAFGFVPFNINPHYLDPEPNSTHMGETRETRINEFHTQQDIPVIGLREGSWLDVKGNDMILNGNLNARFFKKDHAPVEISPGFNFRQA